MKNNRKFSKRIIAIVSVAALLSTAICAFVPALGLSSKADNSVSIVNDGSDADWAAVSTVYGSDNDSVSSWKACYDDNYVYFLIYQNPTGNYGEAVGNTGIGISYNDSEYYNGNYMALNCYQNWNNNGVYAIFDSWYSLVSDATVTFEGGLTDYNQDAAFVEISVPRGWFPSEDFTLTYCGQSVKSTDVFRASGAAMNSAKSEGNGVGDGDSTEAGGEITLPGSDTQDESDAKTEESSEESDSDTTDKTPSDNSSIPVYSGITIDGNSSDWDAITKIQNPRPEILETAFIWDGDYAYIFFREYPAWDGILTQATPYNNGNFVIETQNGSKTSVFITPWYAYVNGSDYVEYAYNNHVYEVKIPTEYLRGFNSSTTSLNFGIMTNKTPDYFVTGVTNLSPGIDTNEDISGTVGKITYDHDYSDWDGYSRTTIHYSTAGGRGTDADASLYSDGDYLYGYVNYTADYYYDAFNLISMCVNGKNKHTCGGSEDCIHFTLRAVDSAGNVRHNYQAACLAPGTYEFYIFDTAYVGAVSNINCDSDFTYGKAYITVHGDSHGNVSGAEMEWYIDIPKVVKILNIPWQYFGAYDWHIKQKNIKTFHICYINIGPQWISCGGTSTGAVIGILLCIGAVVGASFIEKRRKKSGVISG